MIVVTGATGKLGRHVIEALLQKVSAAQIVAAVRSPEKAQDLAASGVQVRQADYEKPDTLRSAFAGAEKVLLISSNEVERRVPQHQAAVDAAKNASVALLAYTLSASDYQSALEGFGVPTFMAELLVDAELGAAKGELDSTSTDLHTLIGRPTVTLAQAVTAALQ